MKKTKKTRSLSPPSGAMRRIGTATATMMEWLNRQAEVALSKSAEEYSIHSASLDGDEFGIVGASPTINSAYKIH